MYNSFEQYAKAKSINLADKSSREVAFKEFRRLYQSEYHKSYSRKNKRISLNLSPEQNKYFCKKAKDHKYKSVAKFILDSAEAYNNQEFLNPSKSELQKLILILRGVSNNVSQIARYFHQGMYSAHSFNEKILFSIVDRMEDKINSFANPILKQSKEK